MGALSPILETQTALNLLLSHLHDVKSSFLYDPKDMYFFVRALLASLQKKAAVLEWPQFSKMGGRKFGGLKEGIGGIQDDSGFGIGIWLVGGRICPLGKTSNLRLTRPMNNGLVCSSRCD
jgi:hypothetical protein